MQQRRSAGKEGSECKVAAVGLEPMQLALVELESAPLDHSGKLSLQIARWTNAILR